MQITALKNLPLNSDVVLSSANYGEQPFLAEDFFDEDDVKGRRKFIQREIEPLVRKSLEYKHWINFIKSTISIDFQCYHTGAMSETCTIHIHHHPYTLYDIVDIILSNSKNYTSFDLAETVMKMHFMNLVGFVPLCETSHELYHSQIIDIPIELVEGNWKDLEKYFEIPDRISSKICDKSNVTLETCNSKWAVDHTGYYTVNAENVTEELIVKHVDRTGWN